jgi:hypothetical protein
VLVTVVTIRGLIALSQVLFSLFIEGFFATRRAEEVSLPLVLRLVFGGGCINRHSTNRVRNLCHFISTFNTNVFSNLETARYQKSVSFENFYPQNTTGCCNNRQTG